MMKRLLPIPIVLTLIYSCSKKMTVDPPSFDVDVTTAVVKAGDDVVFNFSGYADYITFYSGEVGNDYDYIAKDRKFPTLSMDLSFESMVRPNGGGTAGYCQNNQFHFYVASDYDLTGNTKQDSINAIRNATWQEITDEFVICPLECKSTTPYYASGVKNVMNLFEPGKKYHFAFQYINKPNAANGTANIWRFTSFRLLSTVEYIGTTTVLDQSTAGWSPTYIGDNFPAGSYSNAASVITLRGLVNSTAEQELWCISRGIEMGDSTNLGKEFGLTVKSFAGTVTKDYVHKYTNPGEYTAVFVAANSNVDSRKEVIHKVKVTVEP